MSKSQNTSALLTLLSCCLCGLVNSAAAQPEPDPSLWTPVFNPNGQRVVSVVFYNELTGMLGIDCDVLDALRQRDASHL
jgi:hypothetical protein